MTGSFRADVPDLFVSQVVVSTLGDSGWKQPGLRSFRAPVLAKRFQQPRAERNSVRRASSFVLVAMSDKCSSRAGPKPLFRPRLLCRRPFRARQSPGGAELGLTEGAVKVKVHRLRRRFGDKLREEVGRTVEDVKSKSRRNSDICSQ